MPARFESRALVLGAVVPALAVVVYANALHNPFVYDDYHTVVANASIRGLTHLRTIFWGDVSRPLVNLSYALDLAAWGDRPFGFHLTNIVLHALAAFLLFRFMRRVSVSAGPAAAAAALFAVHPMMTEAVGYVSGRSEVLCAVFFLTALLCADRWLRGAGSWWLVPTFCAWIAALATKETAAMFPFVLILYELLAIDASPAERRRRLVVFYTPLMAATLAAGVLRLVVLARIEYPGQVVLHWRYLLLDAEILRRYLGMMVLPARQALFHEVTALRSVFDLRAIVGVAVVGALVATAWRLRRSAWLASFGLLWFVLLLVPSAVLVALDQGEPMTEHRIYLASGGLFLAAGAGFEWIDRRLAPEHDRVRRLGLAGLALVLLSFAGQTWLRNAVWHDPVTLWRESVDLAPGHPRPRLLLGEALRDAGRREEAIDQFRMAIRLKPGDPTGYVEVGRCFAEEGRLTEARQAFGDALAIDPQDAAARRAVKALDRIEAARIGGDGSR